LLVKKKFKKYEFINRIPSFTGAFDLTLLFYFPAVQRDILLFRSLDDIVGHEKSLG